MTLLIGTMFSATVTLGTNNYSTEKQSSIVNEPSFQYYSLQQDYENIINTESSHSTAMDTTENALIEITKPLSSLYIDNDNFFGPGSDPFDGVISSAIIIGPITIEVNIENFTAEKVEFYIDDTLKYVDFYAPYTWTWDEKAFFKHTITCKAYAYADLGDTPVSIQDTQDVIIFNRGVEPSPFYSYEIYQIDYNLDGAVVTNSSFGMIDLTFIGSENPQYFNMYILGDEDTWVIQNMPLIPFEGIGVEQTLSLGFDLGIQDGVDVTELEIASEISDVTKVGDIPAPDPLNPDNGGRKKVNMGTGRQPGPLNPGGPHNEFGDLVESFASHQGPFPNQDCGWNECVPTAVSNSLKWLQEQYGQPPVGKDLSIEAMKEATGWDNSSPNKNQWGCAEGWADLKRTYMEQNGYSITTTEYPDPDDMDHRATADECEAAMRELKDGQDVELNGVGHCAAIVGMARLKDGRYVIYVSHDTDQEHPGGTIIEKIIYDPNQPNPTAEGGWGFNDQIINGFVVECPATRLDLKQSDFDIDDGYHEDTPWGDLELKFDSIPEASYQYLNMKFNGQWIMKNVPLRNANDPDPYTINIPFELGVPKGTEVTSGEYAYELTAEPLTSPPSNIVETGIENNLIHLSSGIAGQNITYTEPPTGPTTNPIWFLGANIVDGAFHPWGSIVNQDCGNNECAPTAVSNSLKTLKNMHPDEMKDLTDDPKSKTDDTDIGTMKPVTGWNASGCPSSGDLSSADAWWNKKDTWMSNNDKYPITTEAVDGANALDTVMDAIKNGKDVEMEIPGHVVMVTGIIKLADGTYVLEVAHDSDQNHDAGRDGKDDKGGVEITLVKYDPKKNEFSGPAWIQGVKLTGSAAEKTIFVIESVTPVDKTDPTVTINYPLNNVEVGNPIIVTGYVNDGPDGSGVVKLEYKLTWASGTYDSSEYLIDPPDNYFSFELGPLDLDIFIDPDDWITITIYATDVADNRGEDSVTVTWVEESEDEIPPVTTKTIGEPQWEGGYTIASFTPIWLDAIDPEPGSGVNHIHYEIWQYGDQIGVEDILGDTVELMFGMYGVLEGIAELHWYAVDNAGNIEEEHIQEHFILY